MSGANVRCAIAEPSVSGAVRCQLRLEPSVGGDPRPGPGRRAQAAAQPAGARALKEVAGSVSCPRGFVSFTHYRVHNPVRLGIGPRHRQYIYAVKLSVIFPPQFALLSTPGRSVPAASAADAVGRYPDSCERTECGLCTLCSGSRQWPGMHRRSCRPVARGQRRHVSNAISNTACESSDRSRPARGGQPLGARRPLQACWASPP